MTKHVISIGDLVIDVILPVQLPVEAGHHQEPEQRRIEPGGAGNFMIAAQRMGLSVLAAGTVGADELGAFLVEQLVAENIDITGVVRVPGSTSTLVIVLVDPETGEHTFIGHYGQGPEVPYPPALNWRIAQADAVFLQGYTLSERRMAPLALRAIDTIEEHGKLLILDVGPFMRHVTAAHIEQVLASTRVVMMTEEEIPFISRGRTGRAAYEDILAQGPEMLVVKEGPAGCSIIQPGEVLSVPGFRAAVIDTVGAGDCFDAAFIAGLLQGLSPWDCGRLANAMGAAAVERLGAGRNVPHCQEVLDRLATAGDRIDFQC
jgi:ribokinase